MKRLSFRKLAPRFTLLALIIALFASLLPVHVVSAQGWVSLSAPYRESTIVDLQWTGQLPTVDCTFLRWEVKRDDSTVATFTAVSKNTYRDKELSKDTTYRYRVFYYYTENATEKYIASSEVSVKTGPAYGKPLFDLTWTAGPHHVDTVTLEGVTLTIEPGAEVIFTGFSPSIQGTALSFTASRVVFKGPGFISFSGAPEFVIEECTCDNVSLYGGNGTAKVLKNKMTGDFYTIDLGASTIEISGNNMTGRCNIYARQNGVSSITISNNRIYTAYIIVEGDKSQSQVSISGNTIKRNPAWPNTTNLGTINVQDGEHSIINNTIGSTILGLIIKFSKPESKATITGNHFFISRGYLAFAVSLNGTSTTPIEMHQNHICLVADCPDFPLPLSYGIDNRGAKEMSINAENNWWGASSGPQAADNSRGEGVWLCSGNASNVKYRKWLESGECPPDLYINNIEPIQVVGSPPLAGGKEMAVRVYVGLNGRDSIYAKVRLDIVGTAGSVKGSPWEQSGTVKRVYTKKDIFMAQDAINLTGITVPVGTYQIKATVDPDDDILESEENNNAASINATWKQMKEKNIAYVGVKVGATGTVPDVAGFMSETADILKSVYPLPEENIHIFDWGYFPYSSVPGGNELASMLEAVRLLRCGVKATGGKHYDFLVGVLPDDLATQMFGKDVEGASYMLRRNAPIVRASKPWALAHELGHYYGLKDEYYDFPLGCWTCPEGGNKIAGVYIYDERRELLYYVGPDKEKSNLFCFMGSMPEYWIEPGCYSKLYDMLRSGSSYDPAQVLLVSGTIHKNDTVELNQWYRFSNGPYEIEPPPPGDYSIECQAANGTALSSTNFTVSFLVNTNPITESDAAGFVFMMEYSDNTSRVVIKHGSTVLKTVNVSANAPQVQVVSPNGGENITGSANITWTGSDADGDNLSYSVFFSNDGGADWRVLATGLTATSYAWDTTASPGGNRCLIKVMATDGINTAEDSSDSSFLIPNKPPQAIISEPADNATFAQGSSITFRGFGYDAEDGKLASSSLSWSSNVSGNISSGALLQCSLPSGNHTITLTTKDSTNLTGSRAIHISVVTDNVSPTINEVSFSPPVVTTNQTVQLSVNATDDLSPTKLVVTAAYQADEYPLSYDTSAGVYRCSLQAPQVGGEYPAIVKAVDTVGNSSNRTAVLKVLSNLKLTMGVSPAGSGTTRPAAGSYTYLSGTTVNITANASSGYEFSYWSGNVSTVANVNSANTTITMNGDYSITANFAKIMYVLTIKVVGCGNTNPMPGTHSYLPNYNELVVAFPCSRWQFSHWSGDASGNDPRVAVFMNAHKTVTANFIQIGDINGDGGVNAQDITKVERIIVGLDPPTAGADANQDGYFDSRDITKVERIIAGLD